MVVIKRAFSLYGAHSKTSGVAQSSNGEVAVREYLTPMCPIIQRLFVSIIYVSNEGRIALKLIQLICKYF